MIVEIGKTTFRLKFSFVAVIILMLLLCEEKIVFLSLLSSFIHESGHLFFICILGDKPNKIELTLFGMRIDRSESYKLSYYKESLIALGGIIFNLLFAFICYIIYLYIGYTEIYMLSVVNMIIAIVNSLPVRILDSGRALKYLFLVKLDENQSEKIIDLLSYFCVLIFVVVTVFYNTYFGINISLIAVTLYLLSITFIKKWS